MAGVWALIPKDCDGGKGQVVARADNPVPVGAGQEEVDVQVGGKPSQRCASGRVEGCRHIGAGLGGLRDAAA